MKFVSSSRIVNPHMLTRDGGDAVDYTVQLAVGDCQKKIGNDNIKIEGFAIALVKDNDLLVTVLASGVEREIQEDE